MKHVANTLLALRAVAKTLDNELIWTVSDELAEKREHLTGLAVAVELLIERTIRQVYPDMIDQSADQDDSAENLADATPLAVDLTDTEAAALRRYAVADHEGDVEQAASALLGQALRQFADVAGRVA